MLRVWLPYYLVECSPLYIYYELLILLLCYYKTSNKPMNSTKPYESIKKLCWFYNILLDSIIGY